MEGVTHRLDDRYIDRIYKRADTAEIEQLAYEAITAARAGGVELDLSRLLFLAFRCGFKAAIG